MNARDAGRNHVGCFCQQLILVGRSILQLQVAVEHEQRGQQNACTVMPKQRSPRLRPERDSIKETTRPIGCDYFALWSLPENRIELIGITVQEPSASAAGSRILGPLRPRSLATIRLVNQLWSHDYAGQKAIKVRQAHAVVRGMVGHQVFVERIEVDYSVQREVVFHVPPSRVAEGA